MSCPFILLVSHICQSSHQQSRTCYKHKQTRQDTSAQVVNSSRVYKSVQPQRGCHQIGGKQKQKHLHFHTCKNTKDRQLGHMGNIQRGWIWFALDLFPDESEAVNQLVHNNLQHIQHHKLNYIKLGFHCVCTRSFKRWHMGQNRLRALRMLDDWEKDEREGRGHK